MTTRKLPAFSLPVLAAVALAGAVAACGGGNSSATPPAPHVTFTTFQAASLVIGQPDFVTAADPGPLSTTISAPYGDPTLVDGILFVPDYGNDRVLAFHGIPAANGAPAVFALGQLDLESSVAGVSTTAVDGPQTVFASGGKLFLNEYTNDRVTIWDAIPTGSAATPSVVVGQEDFVHDVTACTTTNLNGPESIHVAAGRLLVADSNHNRVLVWNTVPTTNGQAPDLVLGQQDFVSCSPNDPDGSFASSVAVTSSTMYYPAGLWSDGTRLVVADASNNRVLVWNTFPARNGQPADLVLGQTSFSGDVANDPATVSTTAGLSYPYFLDSNGAQLFVADEGNHRVLVWNSFPTANGARADVVLGQASLEANMRNDDDQDGHDDLHPSARTLYNPSGVKLIGNRLFVADESNNRYVVYEGR
jgi:hypothetical protein